MNARGPLIEQVRHRAHGQWREILLGLGVDASLLNRRGQSCPMCGGVDRFQYTDKYAQGNYFCRGCGPGDGFKLLQGVFSWSFKQTLLAVAQWLGIDPEPTVLVRHRQRPPTMQQLAESIWAESIPIQANDMAAAYLVQRGLHMSSFPADLRFHPALGYYGINDQGKSCRLAEYPALVAAVRDLQGRLVTLHRTYLQDAQKISHASAKKLLSGGVKGCAIQLFPVQDELAITEGIEKALAMHLATGKPVWSALSSGNMEEIYIPARVQRICIYADHDAHYAGQASAYVLARRLMKSATKQCRQVEVFIPKRVGEDWSDVWLRKQSLKKVA